MGNKTKKVKVPALTLIKALDAASIGNGNGYVLMVDPAIKQGEKTIQAAVLASSDGESLGRCAFQIKAYGFENQEMIYPSKSLRDAAVLLSKMTEMLTMTLKGSYLEIATEDGSSNVRVALNEKDKLLEVPKEEGDNAVFVALKTADFVTAVRCGGFCAAKADREMRAVYFMPHNEKLTVCSFTNYYASTAVAEVAKSMSMPTEEQWHAANDAFIKAVASNLTGDTVQVGFTDKYITISDSDGQIYASRKLAIHLPGIITEMFGRAEREYSGEFKRKDFLLGVDVVTVGIEKALYFKMETAEDGTIRLLSARGENKTSVAQSKHEGRQVKSCLSVEIFKTILSNLGDTIRYYGCNDKKMQVSNMIYFEGEMGKVNYRSFLLKVKDDAASDAADEADESEK